MGLSVLVVFLATSGCATFRCDRLPKQPLNPLLVKKDYLITEQLSYDDISALQFAGQTKGKEAPNLRQAITDAGGRCISDEKIEREIKNAVARVAAIYRSSSAPRKAVLSLAASLHKTYGLAGGRLQTDLVIYDSGNKYDYYTTDDQESLRQLKASLLVYRYFRTDGSFFDKIPGVIMSEEEYAFRCEQVVRKEFYEKMRSDIAVRNQWVPPNSTWVDCKTSITQGNAGTWKLETFLCACSCLLIPVHHNKVLDVEVSVYENEKNYTHKYEDAWNAVCWLPLLPIGLVQGSNDKIVDSIKNNLAIAAVNDFQQDQEKNRK